MRIMLIGDIVGKPGVQTVTQHLPELKKEKQLDLVVANAENAADGSGLNSTIYESLMEAGVDGITLGDHIYRRKEIFPLLKEKKNLVKPANYPRESPGRTWMKLSTRQVGSVYVISLIGRVFMKPVDCPFHTITKLLSKLPPDAKMILIDFHAEATSDMQLMGRMLDGKVSAVLGTHTHVTTADETIFPGGTAFQCDVGMTGPHESIIGRKTQPVLEATLTLQPRQFHVATDDCRLSATIVEISEKTGKAASIERISLS
ncbi:MAG: TIGR00282 family metallophosphoesterase [Pirellulaceae bacterium]|nr:TIGR00282 family metallophosphoesterase [Pirellulaceae bacterium]